MDDRQIRALEFVPWNSCPGIRALEFVPWKFVSQVVDVRRAATSLGAHRHP
jgi:hypothetical protein